MRSMRCNKITDGIIIPNIIIMIYLWREVSMVQPEEQSMLHSELAVTPQANVAICIKRTDIRC